MVTGRTTIFWAIDFFPSWIASWDLDASTFHFGWGNTRSSSGIYHVTFCSLINQLCQFKIRHWNYVFIRDTSMSRTNNYLKMLDWTHQARFRLLCIFYYKVPPMAHHFWQLHSRMLAKQIDNFLSEKAYPTKSLVNNNILR